MPTASAVPEAVSPEGAPLLKVSHLTTTLMTPRGEVCVVDDASFSLQRGSTLGIVGETGSGKTMLIRSIMGLVQDRHVKHAGQVCLDGTDLVPLSEKVMAKSVWGTRLGMVFQDPMTSLAPARRIGHQLTDGLRHHQG